VAEVGQGAAVVAKLSARDAQGAARDIGWLASQALQQVLRGTAEGIDEVVESHRAAKRPVPAQRRAARKSGGRKAGA
jgi:hypothetical protein